MGSEARVLPMRGVGHWEKVGMPHPLEQPMEGVPGVPGGWNWMSSEVTSKPIQLGLGDDGEHGRGSRGGGGMALSRGAAGRFNSDRSSLWNTGNAVPILSGAISALRNWLRAISAKRFGHSSSHPKATNPWENTSGCSGRDGSVAWEDGIRVGMDRALQHQRTARKRSRTWDAWSQPLLRASQSHGHKARSR